MAALFVFGTLGCQTQTESKTVAAQLTNRAKITASQPPDESAVYDKQPEESEPEKDSAAGSLATPTEAYRTAYAARKNKDVKQLKRVLSKDMLEFFAVIGEADTKTIDDALMQLAEKPQGATSETRGEKITGERAMLEYKDEQEKWKTMDFVKEGGEWKLTMPARK